MKAKLSLLAVAILLISAAWVSPKGKYSSDLQGMIVTTPDPNFNSFKTHRKARGVVATWKLTTNVGVTGFVVERTYEDPSDPYAVWENIYAMPCNQSAQFFKHEDENVSPGFISYRVLAFLQVGGSVLSETSTIHIVSH